MLAQYKFITGSFSQEGTMREEAGEMAPPLRVLTTSALLEDWRSDPSTHTWLQEI